MNNVIYFISLITLQPEGSTEHRAGRDPGTLSSEYNIKNDNDEDEIVMSRPKPGLTKQLMTSSDDYE